MKLAKTKKESWMAVLRLARQDAVVWVIRRHQPTRELARLRLVRGLPGTDGVGEHTPQIPRLCVHSEAIPMCLLQIQLLTLLALFCAAR